MRARRALWLWTAGVFTLLAILVAVRLARWTYGADTGTFVQIILDAFGGMRNGVENGTHYRFHWSPALALLWPLLAATHSVYALQLVQVAATVAAGPLVYALVAPRAAPALALRLAILALVYPPLLAVGWGEFHDVGLLTPLVLGALVAADRSCWIAFGLCILVLCGVREDACVEIVLVGTALGFAQPRARVAWFAAAFTAAAVLAAYYGIVIPRVGGSWVPAHFYEYPFAHGPLALLVAPFVAPLACIAAFATFGRLTYVLEALAPLALLPLFSRWSLLALPGLAIVLLANTGLVYHMGNHYAALWIGWLLAGAVYAAAARDARRWCTVALGCTALVLLAFNPMHPAHFLQPSYHDLRAAQQALACVPTRASVATHDEWFTHIAMRDPNATLGTVDGPQYLVFAADYPNAEFQSRLRPELAAEVAAGQYHAVCRFGAVTTYRRNRE